VTLSVLRIGVSACVLAMTTVSQAATPITLPFGDFGQSAEVALPVPPPPPQVVRPDVKQMRLVIKRVPVRGGCGSGSEELRRMTGERRQAAAGPAAKPIRLG
jgi:hypothetical protein